MYPVTDQLQPAPAPGRSFVRSTLRLLGRLLAVALVLAAGVGGWFAVEEYVLAADDASAAPAAAVDSLPALGDGLPTERLPAPEPWRRFRLTYRYTDFDEQQSFDLDTQLIRTVAPSPDHPYESEWGATEGYHRVDGGEWELSPESSYQRNRGFVMRKSGPYLLTDVVPPNALEFVTLLSEQQDGDLRVYRLTMDEEAYEQERPLDHARWVEAIGPLVDGSAERTIRVRPDGFVVHIERDPIERLWDDLPGPIELSSPLADG